MIIYLVKSTLLLALLLGVYKLLLENEKMHTFNRYFLLTALVLGLTAPLIQIDINPTTKIAGVELSKVESTVNAPSEFVARAIEPIITDAPATPPATEVPNENLTHAEPVAPLFSKKEILLGLYGLVTFFFLIRFGAGLFELFSKVRTGDKTSFKKATIILLEESITPQSFIKWIFLNKKDYESGAVAQEILEHELTHIRQKHSLDVLFAEFLKTIFWFNPMLYFYKYSIQLNHEFLADEGAVEVSENVKDYQSILLNFASDSVSKKMTSRFDFLPIKKRFKMIGREFSPLKSFSKSAIIIPAFSLLIFLFCTNSSQEYGFSWGIDSNGNELSPDLNVVPKSPRDSQYFILNGELYTGELNLYGTENNQLYRKQFFKGGLIIGAIWFDEDGSQSVRYENVFESGIQAGFRQFGPNDQIVREWVGTPEPDDSLTVFREWYPNEQLKFEMFSSSGDRRVVVYEGVMTLYDEEGNILEQELYEDGELIEKIK